MLREFLTSIRTAQPTRSQLIEFFGDRRLSDDLPSAVAESMEIARQRGKPFLWLTVTNKGARSINDAACIAAGVTEDDLSKAPPGDPKVQSGPVYAKRGLMVRLTRNLDKDRGFVNGAIGEIEDVFTPTVFTVRLSSNVMILVHPIVEQWLEDDGTKRRFMFLPCTYGYATTIRRAQGSTLDLGCLYFDHVYPPDFGYGYVAASRFRTMDGIFLYGPIRRTDFLPAKARGGGGDYQLRRSALSDDEEETMDDRAGLYLEALQQQMAGRTFIVPSGDYDLLSDAGADDELADVAMSEDPEGHEDALATMADAVDNDLFDLDL